MILVKYKLLLLFTGFLVIVLIGVLIYSKVSASSNPNIKIEVKPTLSLSPCFNNQVPPKTSIVSPTEGSKYITGDKISLTGIAVLECNNSKLDEKDLNWFLDSDATAFAKGYTYNLEGLKAGDHKIKLVSTSGNLKSEVVVNINVSDPKPQVLGIKTPPPVMPPPPPPNQAPVVTINSPKPNESFTIDATLSAVNGGYTLQPIDFRFVGTATDDKDGTIPESSYNWKIGDVSIGMGSTLSYRFTPAQTCPKSLDISLEVKDSAGLVGNSKILILLTYTRLAETLCPTSAG